MYHNWWQALNLYLLSLETKLAKGRLLTTIPRLSTEWIVSFDYKMTELPSSDWLNIIHLTIGNDETRHGDRTPAVFINYGLKKISFHSSVNTESHYGYGYNLDFQLNRKYAFEIHQRYISGGEYRFFVKIDGVQVHSVVNRMATQFYNVKIYASDPWWETGNGWISNLKLTNVLWKQYKE